MFKSIASRREAAGLRARATATSGDVRLITRPFQPPDHTEFTAIDQAAFGGGYSGMHDLPFVRETGYVVRAETVTCLVGYALLFPLPDHPELWNLDTVAVIPERQSAQLGTRLANEAIQTARQLDIVELSCAVLVGTDEDRRRRFVESLGFESTPHGSYTLHLSGTSTAEADE
jgi:GNAT superfamily N-acetyltransferase